MKTLPEEFTANVNQSGVMKFRKIKSGNNGLKNVYIYKRENGSAVFGFEVFVASLKKSGEYPLPNGKTITYSEDFEEYPGASKFGQTAFFCINENLANKRFENFMNTNSNENQSMETTTENATALGVTPVLTIPAVTNETTTDLAPVPATATVETPKTKRVMAMPEGTFTVKELAEKNGVEPVTAFLWLKDAVKASLVVEAGKRVTGKRGKPPTLYRAVTQ